MENKGHRVIKASLILSSDFYIDYLKGKRDPFVKCKCLSEKNGKSFQVKFWTNRRTDGR